MTRLVGLVLALAGCGGKIQEQIGDTCFQNADCDDVPYGYCAFWANQCVRKCGPQAENSSPLGGISDPSCPSNSECVKEGPSWVCLRKCSGTGKICLGLCEDDVCKPACGDVPCRACARGVPEPCVSGLYDRRP